MEIFRNIFILFVVLFMGFIYYRFSVSKSIEAKRLAFFINITWLVLSLILAFFEKEFIIIGNFVFGGRTSIMLLIVIEIVDAFVDIKKV